MSDIVFKNPYRGRRVAKPEPYQSEHERLRVQPKEYPINKTEANAFAEKTSQKKTSVPKQAFVQSGQNEEIMWTKALEEPESEPIKYNEVPLPPPIVRDGEQTRGSGDDVIAAQTKKQEEIEDDVGLEEDNQEDKSFGLDSLNPGDSVLLYNDNVVCVGALNLIKETLADILADAENNVEVEDFIVLKRLKVNIGIFIDE